ncbi:MAG: ADOP family duplicated permease [Acidobacteriota bacterium]
MRPDERDLDDEIRGHLALAIQERVERGEDPDAARRAALAEFGYVGATRESMRRVWTSRWWEAAGALARDLRLAARALARVRGLAATVVVTLAFGIGANAAIFSVVRAVLLEPLVNRDESRLLYIRQQAPGAGTDNLTFSVPEIGDLRTRVTTIGAFGEFSTVEFALVGLGPEPRLVKAGVVNGSFFDVMGLRPHLGRLLGPADDGAEADGAAVLTYRFWTALGGDPSVVGRTIRLGPRAATVVGVLEPSVPYPDDTEIIANIVTSPHHLGATMVTMRTHRMTELFGRLAPGASLEAARAEIAAAHAAMMRAHPEAYPQSAQTAVRVTTLRDQLAAPARPVLLVLLAAAAVVFVIACSNVANLILARSVGREGELAVRAALGAGPGALRRTLLAESLLLCGAGAAVGVLLAQPFAALVARYAARFSVRAFDVTVDASVLWVGGALAAAAAILLAYIPRLPSPSAPAGLGLASGSLRVTPSTNRRLRVFAATQVALTFVLLSGAGMLVATLLTLHAAATGYNLRQVLAVDIPPAATGLAGSTVADFYDQATARIRALPGVEDAAVGSFVPWRDAGTFGAGVSFAVEGRQAADGEENPRARLRLAGPRYFGVVGVPLVAGREFTSDDREASEPVVIVSQSVAARLFPNGEALNRRMWWTEEYFGKPLPRRIVGVAADADDEALVGRPAMTIYMPVRQVGFGGRLFVRAAGDPYALVPAVTRVIRELAADQPVERAATLADIRAEVLSPDRLNAAVFSGFAAVALVIAVVGVAGVLAFSASARTREFGVRLAVGSAPRQVLFRVLGEGLAIAASGIAAGAAGGYALTRAASWLVADVAVPGALPVATATGLLIAAAVAASLIPAARAARIDVMQALRSE